MYAIKIISQDHTRFYLADEVHYSRVSYKNSDDFYSNMENGENVFIIGDTPDGECEYLRLYLYKSFKEDDAIIMYIFPSAWVYIMQEGKTIEAIRIIPMEESIEVK